MALPILDGNQSATTLSTILSSGQHIPAHTVVSLGTQAITDMRGAVSGSVVSISNFPATQPVSIASVTIGNTVTIAGTVTANAGDFASPPLGAYPSKALRIGFADDEQYNAVGLSSGGKPLPVILYNTSEDSIGSSVSGSIPLVISGTVTANLGSALPAGTNRIGVVTIGAGTVTIGNSVTIGSLPAISGTVTANAGDTSFFVAGLDVYAHRSVLYSSSAQGFNNDDGRPVDIDNPLPISGTVTANTFALQGTAVTTSNFTSTTASTVLANFNAGREVLTIFNEGAGNLFVCPGATCTTVQYQIRLSSGDYYEVPNHQTTITHSAVFGTAGTARVTEVS